MTTAATQGITVPEGTWVVDPVHSSVQFMVTDVADLMATIRGRFTEYEGKLEAGENLENARIHGVIRTASISTDQEQRDQHLRSSDFLDAERYPEITFESTRLERSGDDGLRMAGTLTLKDQAQDVELNARLLGVGTSSQGGDRIVIGTDGEIDFGPMKVGLSVNVTAIRQA